MNDRCIYHIQLRGQVDEGEINAMSPFQTTVKRTDATSTLFAVCTDQSGLVGLLRHLHGLGFVFLSVSRVDIETTSKENEQ
jgi:hypothetical protein